MNAKFLPKMPHWKYQEIVLHCFSNGVVVDVDGVRHILRLESEENLVFIVSFFSPRATMKSIR